MPNGYTHHRLWRRFRWLAFAGMILLGVASNDWLMAMAIVPGYYLGSMVDPDMDLMRKNTYAKSIWRRTIWLRWMVPWWTLYGLVAKHFLGGHRSFLTHMPVISTTIRFLWLMAPVVIFTIVAVPTAATYLIQGYYSQMIFSGLLAGLCLSDLVHICADVIM